MSHVAVLGAGLQGVGVALELASRGFTVDLIERDAAPLNRASLRNEGKIHLGFVYAMDRSMATARTMLQGALSFGPLLARWTAGESGNVPLSVPFLYLVPDDSLLPVPELAAHCERVQCLFEEMDGVYLGSTPHTLWRPLARKEFVHHVAGDRIQGGFRTEERALDLVSMRAVLCRHLAARSDISLCTGSSVQAVEREGAGLRVSIRNRSEALRHRHYDQVVNALWDGRLPIDEQMGLTPSRSWVHRLKYRVLVDLPRQLEGLPSMTFVLGPYGDVVTYADGPTYVSWYPQCMRGWSTHAAPPEDWAGACRGELDPGKSVRLGRQALEAFEVLVPGLAQARIRTVDAGVIFAWGQRDIDIEDSELHQRDDIGVCSEDGYHSINTGKLTTAPLFAVHAADRVCEHAGRTP